MKKSISILQIVAVLLVQAVTLQAQNPVGWSNKRSYVINSGIANTMAYTQKVCAISEDCFVALSRDSLGNHSYLELIKDTTLFEQYITMISGWIITDVDVSKEFIYFCGYANGGTIHSFLGRININDWLKNIATGIEFTLLTSSITYNYVDIDSLTQIKVYYDDGNKEHIVCLGVRTDVNTSQQYSCILSVDYNGDFVVNTLIDDEDIEQIQDLDVANKVLTTVSFSKKEYSQYRSGFVVRTYDKRQPDDISLYQYQSFDLTPSFYYSILYPSTDKYFIRAFSTDSAVVVSNALSLNNEDVTAINVLDLQGFIINRSLSIKHEDKEKIIRDVNFSKNEDYLFLVEKAYNPNTNDHTDLEIFLPWNVNTTTAYAYYINNYSPINIPLINSIVPVAYDKYLIAGLDLNTNINCFHILNYNNNNGICEGSFKRKVLQQPISPTGNAYNGFVFFDKGVCFWNTYSNMNTTIEQVHCMD